MPGKSDETSAGDRLAPPRSRLREEREPRRPRTPARPAPPRSRSGRLFGQPERSPRHTLPGSTSRGQRRAMCGGLPPCGPLTREWHEIMDRNVVGRIQEPKLNISVRIIATCRVGRESEVACGGIFLELPAEASSRRTPCRCRARQWPRLSSAIRLLAARRLVLHRIGRRGRRPSPVADRLPATAAAASAAALIRSSRTSSDPRSSARSRSRSTAGVGSFFTVTGTFSASGDLPGERERTSPTRRLG